MSRAATGNLLSIGELGRRVGASPSALRYWERAGLIENVERDNGRRRYRAETVERIGFIRLCQDAGFGISQIAELLATDPDGQGPWRQAAEAKLAEIQAQISRLEAARELLQHTLACPEPSLSVCPTFTTFVRWRAEGELPAPS